MELKTHEEIDDDFIDRGIFTREEINSIKNEFLNRLELHEKAVKIVKRRKFLRGLFYSPWKRTIIFGISPLGSDYKDEVRIEINKLESV